MDKEGRRMNTVANVANLLFEASMLKEIRRSGYRFLGSGTESVAEHSFIVAFISYVMAQMVPGVDALRLISMGLIHDLAEARTGDLNAVQKGYVRADEDKAICDLTKGLPFGGAIAALVEEFNAGATIEAKLARDADQLAFLLDLRSLQDRGYAPATKWQEIVVKRLQTDAGRKMANDIAGVGWDEWWWNNFLDRTEQKG
jgi:putative hydrolase of HD superfamily